MNMADYIIEKDDFIGQAIKKYTKKGQKAGIAKLHAHKAWDRYQTLRKAGKFDNLNYQDQQSKALRIMAFGGSMEAEQLYNLGIDAEDLAVAINAHTLDSIDSSYLTNTAHWKSGSQVVLPSGVVVTFEFNYTEGSCVKINGDIIYGEGL